MDKISELGWNPTVVFWTFTAISTATVIFLTWWQGNAASRATERGAKRSKPLRQSPGVQIVRVSAEVDGSPTGAKRWTTKIAEAVSSAAGGTSKWEQSKRKGDMGYYFAHHTSAKVLAPEEYEMNGPKLLSKSTDTSSPAKVASLRQECRPKAKSFSSYAWEDCGEEVRLTFRQGSWVWGKVEESEVRVEWSPWRFRLAVDSSEYGLHAMEIPRLSNEIAGVRVLKLRSRLVVALVKGGGSYRKAPWESLHANVDPPSQD